MKSTDLLGTLLLLITAALSSGCQTYVIDLPTSTLVCSPPTSSLPSAVTSLASFACSPCSTTYLDAEASSEPAAHAPADAQRVGDGSPALRIAGFVRGEARTFRVTGLLAGSRPLPS